MTIPNDSIEWWEATSKEVQRVQEISGQERCRTKGFWSWEHGKGGYLGGRGCCVGRGRRRSSSCRLVAGSPISEWCCCYCVLSLQEDFINEKPIFNIILNLKATFALFFPSFIANWTQLRCCGDLWNIIHYSLKVSSLGNLTPTINSGYQQLSDGSFKTAKKTHPWVPWYVWYINHPLLLQDLALHGFLPVCISMSFVYQILIILSGWVLILSKLPLPSGNINLTKKLVPLWKSSNFWPSARLCWPKGLLNNIIHHLHLFNTIFYGSFTIVDA